KPAYVQMVNDPDWVPSLHLGYDKKQDESRRYERLQQRKSKKATGTITLPSVQPSSKSGNTTSEEVSNLHTEEQETKSATKDTEKCIQTDLTVNFISVLENEVHTLAQDLIYAKSEIEKYTFDEKYFKINEEKVKYYTGLPTFNLLKNVYVYLEPAITMTSRSCLTKFQQFLIVVFKLKLSLPFRVLADMFKIHPTTASKIFTKVLDVMYVNMSDLIFWPDKESLRKTMPK
ncbi:nuclease harbi1, partial [Biomphalaria glabrata]